MINRYRRSTWSVNANNSGTSDMMPINTNTLCLGSDVSMLEQRNYDLEQENKKLREIVLKMYENRFEPDKLCIYKHKALSQTKGEEG